MSSQGSAETFGRWLDLTMGNQGIKGRTLARKLRVHDSAVSRWRSGQGAPEMDTCMRLAKILDVDPIRLAVTAGLMDGDLIGVETLPLPEPTAQRQAVRGQLEKLRLPPREREQLIEFYEVAEKIRTVDGDELARVNEALGVLRQVLRGETV